MAYNITADEVRYTGGLTENQASDTMLESAAFIPAGDAWLNQILVMNGETTLALITDANKAALAKAAECFYVAGMAVNRTPLDSFKIGPVESKAQATKDKIEFAKSLMKSAEEMLDKCGYKTIEFKTYTKGGSDYHPSGSDKTNIDLRYVSAANPFDVQGGEQI